MNAQAPAIDLKNFDRPGRLFVPFKPIPQFAEEALDDVLLFELPDDDFQDETPTHTELPAMHTPVLSVNPEHVPASVLRRIAREISENECDPRTVFTACRGLTKGSLPFEEAYTAARIRSFTKSQRVIIDPYLSDQPKTMNTLTNTTQATRKNPLPCPSNPMAVMHLGHLMDHFGIWVIGLLGAQLWCAWKTAGFACEFLEGEHRFYFGAALTVMLAFDMWVWFTRRRNLSHVFHVPGAVLFLTALVPVFLLYVRGVLNFAQ